MDHFILFQCVCVISFNFPKGFSRQEVQYYLSVVDGAEGHQVTLPHSIVYGEERLAVRALYGCQ